MATKSFLKNITVKNRASASAFIDALEHAEGKKRKTINVDKSIESVKDKEKIRRLFNKQSSEL